MEYGPFRIQIGARPHGLKQKVDGSFTLLEVIGTKIDLIRCMNAHGNTVSIKFSRDIPPRLLLQPDTPAKAVLKGVESPFLQPGCRLFGVLESLIVKGLTVASRTKSDHESTPFLCYISKMCSHRPL